MIYSAHIFRHKIMKKTLYQSLIGAAALVLLGAGCGGSAASTGPDGGIFKSVDAGTTWVSKSRLLTVGTPASFAPTDVTTVVVDPKDPKAMWVGTSANGIFYTFDGGEGWLIAKNFAPAELMLTESIVNGLAVDPENSCVVYATITAPTTKSYLIRTVNCGRSWGVLYAFNELKEEQLRAVAVNPSNPKQLFLGDTAGDVFRSDNAGASWKKVVRFEDRAIRTIAIHKNGNVFVGTARGGLRMSYDAGENWQQAELKQFAGAEEVYAIAFAPANPTRLLIGTKYGILRSDDLGKTWTAYELLTAPIETQILSVAVNPKNSNRIFYGTPSGFYRTEDDGKTWTTKRMPTTRVPKNILVDVQKGADGAAVELLWVGMWRPPQK
ncbi:MAG: hypothetical protein A2848_02815 [Candidatus Magasanikbacteria bacterium RIFCSPHIGHO2_01_FULL_50_8]|uniref:Photosynthesis system II assembly factor Ycf48/Hcf136-like domain-containing protein n=2 Tax=Candidatus Magasanikiibacteriota TaxID=1752731 RepID=A0A1F6LML5_9BACT|nr:MAG: hypothetical protein A2848_02815 [Candidatus Magasanikbacteria bacterium RIFCSPHIGHO2_01_FULL_50_8]